MWFPQFLIASDADARRRNDQWKALTIDHLPSSTRRLARVGVVGLSSGPRRLAMSPPLAAAGVLEKNVGPVDCVT
jgi:hypothetical protein